MLCYVQDLPEGFDASVTLPGADASSKQSITDTFPLVFVLRWLTLRSEVRSRDAQCRAQCQLCSMSDSQLRSAKFEACLVHVQLPEDEWESYGKGQHLRGADAVFADQILDELVRGLPSAYGLLYKQSNS